MDAFLESCNLHPVMSPLGRVDPETIHRTMAATSMLPFTSHRNAAPVPKSRLKHQHSDFMSDIIALFDMDNTLFDYEGKLKSDLKLLMSDGEEEPENIWDETKPWLKARIDLITSVPGWWRTLPKFQLGWDLYDLCDELGFECHVLTKGPRQKSFAWSEKVDCIQEHFGDAVNIDIVGKDKRGSYGRVLVDDYSTYILGWLEHRPRGLAIMPAHAYNEGFEHPNVIRYTGENLEEIQRLLVAVRQRKPGEHWDRYL